MKLHRVHRLFANRLSTAPDVTVRPPKRWLQRRRALYIEALAKAKITQEQFRAAGGYSRNHLNEVVRGNRTSARIEGAIATLIREQLHVEL